ncbi:unnamed protein product [Tenebrio molitor]|nr:unnamed protein product [Tenebrio molitor]
MPKCNLDEFGNKNSNLLYKFYKTTILSARCTRRALKNTCDKMAYKTNYNTIFFLFCPYFKFKKS